MRLLTILLTITLLLSSPGLQATGIPWKQQSSFQFAQAIPLKELLQGFFTLQDLNVVISDKVEGTVNGTFEDVKPEDFLDQLSRAYGLSWYYSGNVVYIYSTQEVKSELVEMTPIAAAELLKTVDFLGIVAPSSSIRILNKSGLTTISGPPGYVDLVTTVAKRLNETMRISYSEQPVIKIFPLRYAWAYDTTFTTQNTVVTIPGIASVLRGLMETGTNVAPSVISGDKKEKLPNLASKQPKLEKTEPQSAMRQKAKPEEGDKDSDPKTSLYRGATLIQADTRLNAVIVRDVPERMAQYEDIIKNLDIPVEIIEISASIIDINTNFSRGLGNKFLSIEKDHKLAFKTDPDSTSFNTDLPTSGFNFDFGSAGLVVNGFKILSKIEALEREGKAETLARPSVLTLDNIEAVISSSNTFYVSLTGTESTDLANVTVGTTLRVTPRVIDEGEKDLRKIKLLINIEDGAIGDSSSDVGGVPGTSNSTISTQAVIYENQSLLIGGNHRQTYDKTDSGIPLLRNIPFLGYVFKRESITKNTLERMYLITPRIVNLKYEKEPAHREYFEEPIQGLGHATNEVPHHNLKEVCPVMNTEMNPELPLAKNQAPKRHAKKSFQRRSISQ